MLFRSSQISFATASARGARKWNDANILVMSLRATPEAVGKEICDAWLETGPDEAERATIAKVESH